MSTKDGIERELKFECPDLGGLKEQLQKLEAERVTPHGFEDNLVLDRDDELTRRGCLLRLRNDRHGARLTYKGLASYEESTRIREEHETGASDPEAMRRILENLGYRVVTRYQKYREEWQLGGVTVALDHTPVGDFAEFEGDGAEKVAKRCGFDVTLAERRSYLQIYSDYRDSHPEAPADMVFPS